MADVPLMNNPMTTAEDIIKGGASGAPARLAVGTNGHVLTVTAGAVGWAAAAGGGFTNGAYDIERRTAGDLSVTTTTAGTAIPTLGNLIVGGASGDLLLIGLDVVLAADSESTRFDVASIVSAAAVNFVSSLTGTANAAGIPGWSRSVTTLEHISATIAYVAQAGDVSGGNIELSLRSWLASGTSRTVQANSGSPLVFWVKNLKQ